MAIFSVYARDHLIGHSRLEGGDPPMGVAFGALEPTPDYASVKAACIASQGDQAHLGWFVCTDAGVRIECAGVGILDCDVDGEPPEVNVLGIASPPYAELFPEHVAAYEKLFK